ncbi:MAG TPA: hypothetical protein EYH31_00530, partial [Anaerolineae bacterium]|nr:hypothetical protein [Anaerolineae bacterium]
SKDRSSGAIHDSPFSILHFPSSILHLPFSILHSSFPLGWPGVLLYALALGALGFLNTWDFPIYLVLAVGAYTVVRVWDRGRLDAQVLGESALAAIVLAVLGVLLYLPFYLGFSSQAGGILPNFLFPTRLTHWLIMFGPLLAAVLCLLLLASVGQQGLQRRWLSLLPWTMGLPLLFLILVLSIGLLTPWGQHYVARLMDNPAVREQVGNATWGQLLGTVLRVRVGSPWTYLLLAGLLAWVLALVWLTLEQSPSRLSRTGKKREIGDITRDPTLTFALLMTALALLLSFTVEFAYLRDNFGTRMNTVFKFYYQAWNLLALAGAYGAARLLMSEARARLMVAVRVPALALTGVLVLAGLLYPIFAIDSKANGFHRPATLDGLAWLQEARPDDYQAIQWVAKNVQPVPTVREMPVVLEAVGSSYDRDGAGRVSMATGFPTVLGWDGHEAQWRGKEYGPLVGSRPQDVERIYRSATGAELAQLLDRYGILYVFVGQVERIKYGVTPQTLARFDRALEKVYDEGNVRIYRRKGVIPNPS